MRRRVPDGARRGYRCGDATVAPRRVFCGGDGHRQPRSSGRISPRDLDATLRGASSSPTRTGSTRSRSGCSATARDAEEAAQDALVGPTGRSPTTTPTRIRELRLRPWLATIVLNLCRTRVGRRARHGAPRRSRSTSSVAAARARATDATTSPPSPSCERRRRARALGRPAACLPPAYRAAVVLRHVDGLSYPETRRPPSAGPRAPSRPRSIAAWRCCAPPSSRASASSARR